MKGFYLALEVSKYYATIDCESRVVTFCKPAQDELIYQGCRSSLFASTVSMSRAKKLINSSCVAYLATVVEDRKDILVLENIHIVQEFSDVFPVELPGMPPDQEIEFVIDLIDDSRAVPISKTPYWMAPTELKELKAQLQDLLNKGFIKPSVSP